MDGSEIVGAFTLGSRYDQNSIAVQVKGNDGTKTYRITANEIAKMMKHFVFAENKSRKHIYLDVQRKKEETYTCSWCNKVCAGKPQHTLLNHKFCSAGCYNESADHYE